MSEKTVDLLIKNLNVVRSGRSDVRRQDVAITAGKLSATADRIDNRMAELTAWNPARRFGLPSKGDIAPGFAADLAIVDPDQSFTVRAGESESTRGYSPFEGLELTGRVVTTYLRGVAIDDQGRIVGKAGGRYLARPY